MTKRSMEDFDDVGNQTPDEFEGLPGEVLTGELGDFTDDVTVPEDSGKSLTALVAAWLGGILLSFMVAKGWMTPDQSAEFAPAITGTVVLAVGYVTARFLKSRSEVKVAALQATAAVRSARAGAQAGSPFGASGLRSGSFSIESLAGILASLNAMVAFLPLSPAAKKQVRKALTAAITALGTYQQDN